MARRDGKGGARQRKPSRAERRARERRALEEKARQLVVRLPERRHEPETVVAHLGPTNSGKTHDALAFLSTVGRGVYAAPLRMLAQEAHRRLGAQLGEEKVGLVTGEERVNDGAPIICCTVEMAPSRGEVLVLDEVQWADDEERGSAWTRLMLAGEYRHVLLLGATDAQPLVERAFPQVDIIFFERKSPLEFVGRRRLRGLSPGTVVVAFSRRAVLALAGELNRTRPGKVAVLYGAMPLSSRRAEIDRFLSGEAEVAAATDVLGHGVNLPCETLLFAETSKFDGRERRDLEPWEIAQIAGRAGRFGFHERGHVGVLADIPWARPDADLVEAAIVPHVELPGGHMGYRVVDTGRLRPRLEDLDIEDARELAGALQVWARVAAREWAGETWVSVESIVPLMARLDAVQRHLNERGRRLDLQDAWRLVTAPVDDDHLELLGLLALVVARDRSRKPFFDFLLDWRRLGTASLEEAEDAARVAAILRWFALQYEGLAGITIDRAAELEERAAARVTELLRHEVEHGTVGRCLKCGMPAAPWHPLCDRCYAGATSRGRVVRPREPR